MATSITSGGNTITPALVLGYESSREVRTIVHPILGSENVDVILRPAALATGSLELLFRGSGAQAASATAETVLSTGAVCALTSTEATSIAMSFVVTGSVTRRLDPVTRINWIVGIDWQEVA